MLRKTHSTVAVLLSLRGLLVDLSLLNDLFSDTLMKNNSSMNHEEVCDRAVELIRQRLADLDFILIYNGEGCMFYIAGQFSPTFNGTNLYRLINWLKYIIG